LPTHSSCNGGGGHERP